MIICTICCWWGNMIIAFIYSMIKNLFLHDVRFLRIRAKTTHLGCIQSFETLASKTFTKRNKQYGNVRIANTSVHFSIVTSLYECCFLFIECICFFVCILLMCPNQGTQKQESKFIWKGFFHFKVQNMISIYNDNTRNIVI